jgi:hypothetical protein
MCSATVNGTILFCAISKCIVIIIPIEFDVVAFIALYETRLIFSCTEPSSMLALPYCLLANYTSYVFFVMRPKSPNIVHIAFVYIYPVYSCASMFMLTYRILLRGKRFYFMSNPSGRTEPWGLLSL